MTFFIKSTIAQIAKENSKERFTGLAYLLDKNMLKACHRELQRRKASGIDGITKAEYKENVDERIELLHYGFRVRYLD